jgi:hypothetical protein
MRVLRQRSGQAVEMAETASAGLQAMQDGRDKALEELAEARATLEKRDRLVGSQDEAMVLLKKECEKAKREAKQNGKARRAGELTIQELHGLLTRTKDEAASRGRILEEKMAMQVRRRGGGGGGRGEGEGEGEGERERDTQSTLRAYMSVCGRLQQTHTDTYRHIQLDTY